MASHIPNRGPTLLAVDIAFMTTALIAYGLRIYVRVGMVKAFGMDDWLMAAATISFVAYASSSIIGVHFGTGRHHKDLTVEGVQRATHCWWFCYLFYCCSMITSKCSIGCFLLRVAIKKLHTWIIYGAMLISIVAGSVFFFVTLFQCHPISYFWNKTQDGHCVSIEVIIGLAYLYSTFSIISDFTFALLPAFLVVDLQLKRRTKIALIPLLTMGCIASAAVVARVPYLSRFRSPDFLWATLDIAIWSTVEQGLAITAGSLATLRPLFSLVLFKMGISTKPSGRRPSNYGYGQSPSASNALHSRRKQSRDELDMYNLSTKTEAQSSRDTIIQEPDAKNKELPKPPNSTWYQTTVERVKSGQFSKPKKERKDSDGSEKSLRRTDTADSAEDGQDRSMQIMISRSFFVSDSERATYAEKQPPPR